MKIRFVILLLIVLMMVSSVSALDTLNDGNLENGETICGFYVYGTGVKGTGCNFEISSGYLKDSEKNNRIYIEGSKMVSVDLFKGEYYKKIINPSKNPSAFEFKSEIPQFKIAGINLIGKITDSILIYNSDNKGLIISKKQGNITKEWLKNIPENTEILLLADKIFIFLEKCGINTQKCLKVYNMNGYLSEDIFISFNSRCILRVSEIIFEGGGN